MDDPTQTAPPAPKEHNLHSEFDPADNEVEKATCTCGWESPWYHKGTAFAYEDWQRHASRERAKGHREAQGYEED